MVCKDNALRFGIPWIEFDETFISGMNPNNMKNSV